MNSAPPVPKPPKPDNRRLICACPKSDSGEFLRDADGLFVVNEKCPIHGRRKAWRDNVYKKSLEYDAKR